MTLESFLHFKREKKLFSATVFLSPLFKVNKNVVKFSFTQQKIFWVLVFVFGLSNGQINNASFIASRTEVISEKAKKVNLRFFISIFKFNFSIFFQILVAPILDPKKTKRNIYLPKIPVSDNKEAWIEENEKTCYEGGRWLNETTVELHKVAYFKRILHKDCL